MTALRGRALVSGTLEKGREGLALASVWCKRRVSGFLFLFLVRLWRRCMSASGGAGARVSEFRHRFVGRTVGVISLL